MEAAYTEYAGRPAEDDKLNKLNFEEGSLGFAGIGVYSWRLLIP
jgi:hypothetical protein